MHSENKIIYEDHFMFTNHGKLVRIQGYFQNNTFTCENFTTIELNINIPFHLTLKINTVCNIASWTSLDHYLVYGIQYKDQDIKLIKYQQWFEIIKDKIESYKNYIEITRDVMSKNDELIEDNKLLKLELESLKSTDNKKRKASKPSSNEEGQPKIVSKGRKTSNDDLIENIQSNDTLVSTPITSLQILHDGSSLATKK